MAIEQVIKAGFSQAFQKNIYDETVIGKLAHTEFKDGVIYFAFIKENKQLFGEEIAVDCQKQDTVSIHIHASFTDGLTVPNGEESAEYFYGIKLCTTDGTDEETLLIGNNATPIDFNKVKVYPKRVEGTNNTNNSNNDEENS